MSSKNVVDLRKKKLGGPDTSQAPLPLRPQKRVSPVRVRRRRTRIIFLSVVLSLLISGTLVAGYISYLPRYSVGTITVQGVRNVKPELVIEYAQSLIYNGSHNFFSRANVLLYPKALIEKDIPLEFPRIASAEVTTSSLLSSALTIQVVERQPFALWCDSNNTCYQMDQNGFIYAQTPSAASSTEYMFTGGISTSSPPIGQTFVPGHTQGLVTFLQLLASSGYTPLGANVQSDQDFTVPLEQGYYIYASFGEDPGTLVSELGLVLSSDTLSAAQVSQLDYVDLRFSGRLYYKLKGQDQTQASTTSQ